MNVKFDSLLYPKTKMDIMKRAMAKSGVSGVPTNRADRRRLNANLRKLGAPELQVSALCTAGEPEHPREQGEVAPYLSTEYAVLR